MAKFRKKPVEIEAIQFTDEESGSKIIEWMGDPETEITYRDYGAFRLDIHTLEGTMTASLDDWIIKGVQGEFYPCKPDIFEETYERVF